MLKIDVYFVLYAFNWMETQFWRHFSILISFCYFVLVLHLSHVAANVLKFKVRFWRSILLFNILILIVKFYQLGKDLRKNGENKINLRGIPPVLFVVNVSCNVKYKL